jgi:hypothetical protein
MLQARRIDWPKDPIPLDRGHLRMYHAVRLDQLRTRAGDIQAVQDADSLGISIEAVGGICHAVVTRHRSDRARNASGRYSAHLDRIASVTGMRRRDAEWRINFIHAATFPNWDRHLAQVRRSDT